MDRVKYVIIAIAFIIPFSSVQADEIAIHGFVQANYTLRATGLQPSSGSDFIVAEERAQLKLGAQSSSANGAFLLKADLFHDAIDDHSGVELREAYVDYGEKFYYVRIGRQIITWGLGDLLFINDTFPKDWVALFSGKLIEYLKIGTDAVKFDLYSDAVSAEFVWIPSFEPDNIPTSEIFFLFDPFSQVSNRSIIEPEMTFENTELAIRLYRDILGFDTSLYAYKGFFRTPTGEPDDFLSPTVITFFFPKLSVYGLSAQRGLFSGVASIELGYYDSKEDRDGSDPLIQNSQMKFLIGYQMPLWKDFTVGLQYYGEYMDDYAEYENSISSGFPKLDRLNQFITLRIIQMLKYQTLKLSLFSFYSPNNEDYLIIPEVSYHLSDELWIALGGNIFGGEKEVTFFGQFDKDDNVYTTLRYEF